MKYLNGKIYRIYKVADNRTIYIGSTKQKYLSQVLQNWIQYYKTDEPLSYDIELLRSVPCISIDELNKARRTCRDEYAEAEPPPVEAPKVEAPKVARLNTIPEHTTTRPRKVGLTPEDVRRLTASMF
jgi:hypothetical protein